VRKQARRVGACVVSWVQASAEMMWEWVCE